MRSRESQLNKRRHRRRHKGYPIGRALQLAANVGCNKIVNYVEGEFTSLHRSNVNRRLEMHNFDIAPFILQIFRHKTAVAMMWLIFAAKQASSIQSGTVDFLDFAARHE